MRLGGIFDYAEKRDRLEEVSRELEDPGVWSKPEQAQALGRERAQLESIIPSAQTSVLELFAKIGTECIADTNLHAFECMIVHQKDF